MSGADHLCVLVHGLWGSPKHLSYVASALRERYPEDKLHILVTQRNQGLLTYDGCELGGERVTQEVEETLDSLARAGHPVRKISFVGYSLGGLVARYAVGLLYSRGWFDKVEPVNFTTFATPHLGARAPLVGYMSRLFNSIGPRMLSMSGRQLFLIDDFRGTGRPLLSILADPDSVFIRALRCFKQRSLYTNIVNDRTAVYYSTSISKTDPYVRINNVKVNYVPGYDSIIVDSERPVSPKDEEALSQRMLGRGRTLLYQVPLVALLGILLPIGFTVFSVASVFHAAQSRERIRLHDAGKLGIAQGMYRIPLMMQDAQHAADSVYGSVANTHDQHYLPDTGAHDSGALSLSSSSSDGAADGSHEKLMSGGSVSKENAVGKRGKIGKSRSADLPTLALTPAQFAMIQSLDDVGWQKFPVHIHNVGHSHAAIIVRMQAKRYDEGKVVVRHWLERFQI